MSGSPKGHNWKIPREPDFFIGKRDNPYMRRWWVIPRNRIFNIYLHNICRSDDDRALHDHPWWNLSILLKGQYLERTPLGEHVRKRGSLVLRRASSAHRLEIIDGSVWTLFITGPVIRSWGFWCPQGWRHWKEFVSIVPGGNETGRGCD